jgi:hypothetical protein
VLASLTPNEAGWLSRHISDRIEKEGTSAGDEIESELKVLSPFPSQVNIQMIFLASLPCS